MSDYPNLDLPPVDHVREAAEHHIKVSRSVLGLIWHPGKRRELDEAANELERLMRDHARPSRLVTAETKGKLL